MITVFPVVTQCFVTSLVDVSLDLQSNGITFFKKTLEKKFESDTMLCYFNLVSFCMRIQSEIRE